MALLAMLLQDPFDIGVKRRLRSRAQGQDCDENKERRHSEHETFQSTLVYQPAERLNEEWETEQRDTKNSLRSSDRGSHGEGKHGPQSRQPRISSAPFPQIASTCSRSERSGLTRASMS